MLELSARSGNTAAKNVENNLWKFPGHMRQWINVILQKNTNPVVEFLNWAKRHQALSGDVKLLLVHYCTFVTPSSVLFVGCRIKLTVFLRKQNYFFSRCKGGPGKSLIVRIFNMWYDIQYYNIGCDTGPYTLKSCRNVFLITCVWSTTKPLKLICIIWNYIEN
jgi:hypothetical protein